MVKCKYWIGVSPVGKGSSEEDFLLFYGKIL